MFSKKRLVAIAAGLLLLAGISVQAQKRTRAKKPPAVKAPEVVPVDLPAFKKLLQRDSTKPLLVNFWATWCDPCREEFPDLVKLDAEYRPKGLDFIAITLDDLADIKTSVPKFLREMRAQMPNYLLNVADPEPAIMFVDPNWGGAMPATFLYNPKGEVVFKTFGRVKVPELQAAIEKALNAVPSQTSNAKTVDGAPAKSIP